MPFRFVSEPRNGLTLVCTGLDRLSARVSPLSEHGIDFNALQVKPPHAVYDLRADEIAGGKGLASAHATGFRYLIEAAGRAVAAAETHSGPSGCPALLTNLNYGPFVEATARAFEQLANLDAVRTGSYEARFLRFSAISLTAIWLKGDARSADIIYLLPPAPDVVRAKTPYAVDDFFKAILPMARKRALSKGSVIAP